MGKLRDFIGERARELEDSLLELRAQLQETQRKIAAVEKELLDVRNAAKAIGIPKGIQELPLFVTRKAKPPVTIKQAVLMVLADYPEGLIALDILAKINERFGMEITRTSLSPQLTRLKKNDHKIINRGSTWILATTPDHNHTYR